MKNSTLHKSIILLCALFIGSGNALGQTTTIDFENNAIPTGWTNTNDMAVVSNPISNTSSTNGSYCLSTNGKASNSLTSGYIENIVSISVDATRTSNNTTNEVYIDFCPNTSFGNTDTQTQSVTVNKNSWYTSTLTLSTKASGYVRIRRSGGNSTATKFIDNIVITCSTSGGGDTPTTHTLTYSATNGSIAGEDAEHATVNSGASLAANAEVTLTANPSNGYVFSYWTVNGTGSSLTSRSTNPTTFTMGSANATVTATFVSAANCLTTMDAIFSAATSAGSTATDKYVTFNNWVVSGVSGSTAYVTDNNGKGFIVYKSNHGFNAGDILSGTAQASLKLYNGAAEFTTLTKDTPGLNVTTGGNVTSQVAAISDLGGVNTGALVQLNGVTYDGTNLKDASNNEIKPYNSLYNSMSFANGSQYNVKGVFLQYGDIKEILPRSSSDIVLVQDPTITTGSNSITNFTYVEGSGPSAAQTVSVSGSNLTANISLSLGDNSNYEMCLTDNGTYTNSLTLTQSNGTVSTTNVYVRLKSGLTKSANYAGTITLTSTGATDKTVSLSGSVSGQAHAVTVATGLTGGTIEADPTSAAEGATISLTANPEDAYTFGSWSVYKTGDQSTTVTVENNQFSMPDYAVTVTATFTAKPTHTATFSVNGTTTSNTFYEGQAIVFPTNLADISGKKFVGWTTATISGTTNTAPTLVTSATMGNSDITYYAVFATISGSTTPANMVINTSTTNFPTSYGTANTFAEYTLNGKKFQIQQGYINGTKLQWRASGNDNGTGTMYNSDAINKIQSIVLLYDSSDSNKNFTVQVGSSANPSSASAITPSISQQNTSEYTFNCSSGNYDFFVLTNGSGAGYLTSITINYLDGSQTISNYCTTVVAGTYSVTYDGNDATSGSVPTDNTAYTSGQSVTVAGNTGNLAKTGCTFGGWNTQANGKGTRYVANDTFNITEDTTLYAIWESVTLSSYSVEAMAAGVEEACLAIDYANINIAKVDDFDIVFYDNENHVLEGENVPDWITAIIDEADAPAEGYVVSYTIDPNDGDARTAYFKVFALGSEDYVYSELVTITQAAYVATSSFSLFSGDLVEGDYIICYDGSAIKNTVSSKRLSYVSATPSENQITTNDASIVWHIAPNGNYWTIYSAEVNAYAASNGTKNQAQMLEGNPNDNALWTVNANNEDNNYTYDFVNKANSANEVNAYLRNNKDTNNNYGFACYASTTGGALSLYKFVSDPTPVSVTAKLIDGRYWATFYNGPGLRYKLPAGAKAYTMNAEHKLYILGEDGSVIPANTAVIIIADVTGTATATKVISLENVPNAGTIEVHGEGNILSGSTTTVSVSGLTAENKVPYVLGKPEGESLGFYQFTGDAIPANKAYYTETINE